MGKLKLLITGGSGRLGLNLAAFFSDKRKVEFEALPKKALDVSSQVEVSEVISTIKPDVVVNTAAVLVEDCENDVESAFRVNAWGARNLAVACTRQNSVLIQISTSGLFGDDIRYYHEYDPVTLKTKYAKSKYAGEDYVRSICPKHFILRLGWLYGTARPMEKPDFVVGRLKEAEGKKEVYSAGDKHGSPVFADDIFPAIESLLETKAYGTYHLANNGGCTRADYVRYILREFNIKAQVVPVDSSKFPRKADVPDCEMLRSLNLGFAGIDPLPIWQESLARYIRFLRKEIGVCG